jgi:predicted DNA binding CopG/RHH family protein
MSPKKVNFGKKPEAQETTDVENWVSDRSSVVSPLPQEQPEKMKRLTLDIPESLHKAIKRQAVDAGVTMADLLRELLEQHYGTKQ